MYMYDHIMYDLCMYDHIIMERVQGQGYSLRTLLHSTSDPQKMHKVPCSYLATMTAAAKEIPLDRPSVARQIQQKERLRNKHYEFEGPDASSSSSSSLPPGNHPVNRWIVLDLGLTPPPSYYQQEWALELDFGNDDASSYTLTREDLQNLRLRSQQSNWHCVTGWSATNLEFEGVYFHELLEYPPIQRRLRSMKHWSWLYCESADGYTVPIHREDLDETAMLVFKYNGQPISKEHGGPRLLLPQLFGWKSAKWVVRWKFLTEYQPGFWERLGCHRRGRHGLNERFDPKLEGIWKWIAAAPGLYRWAFGSQVWIWIMQLGGNLLGSIILSGFPSLHPIPAIGSSTNKSEKDD
jgi:DMSO/TMAO reductase YedYZ molybdopterin-dependent catalytic subunit